MSGVGGEAGRASWKTPLTQPVLCPQEPDQVYEGITFDDFLKVGVWERVAVCRGVGGWRGSPLFRRLASPWKGVELGCGLPKNLNCFYLTFY